MRLWHVHCKKFQGGEILFEADVHRIMNDPLPIHICCPAMNERIQFCSDLERILTRLLPYLYKQKN